MKQTDPTEGILTIYYKSGRDMVFNVTSDEYSLLLDEDEEDAFVATDGTVVQVNLAEVESMTFKAVE